MVKGKKKAKKKEEKDPYEEILEVLEGYEKDMVPRDTTDYEM